MYLDAERILARAAFVHYEIANWARHGSQSRHNLVYWRDGEWLGVGVGAHSHLGGKRFWNDMRFATYIQGWSGIVPETQGRPGDAARTPILAPPPARGPPVAQLAAPH